MSIFVRPFRATDLAAFVPIEPMGIDELKDPKLAQAIEDSKLAVTGIRNGRIIGCGGVHPIPTDSEQGELWLRLSEECLKHKIDTYRWLKSGLKIIEETFPFRQLNAVIQCSYKKGIKLVEHFGFRRVQISKKHITYAKLVRD